MKIAGDYLVFERFQVWELSNFHTLPCAGAWDDQPVWIQQGFKKLLLWRRWWKLNNELTEPGGNDDIPTAEQLFGES